MIATVPTIAALLAATGVLVQVQRSNLARVPRERRALLDGLASVLDDVRVSQESIGFPAATGTHRGERVRVEMLADTLNLRQLPRLWLVVSLLRSTGLGAAVDIVRDPQVPDNVSPTERFRHEHPAPADWPRPVRIATATPASPDLEPFAAMVALWRADTKEVLAGPGGIRIVTELARGELGQWRVTRRARFEVDPPHEQIAVLLEEAQALADRLDAARVPA